MPMPIFIFIPISIMVVDVETGVFDRDFKCIKFSTSSFVTVSPAVASAPVELNGSGRFLGKRNVAAPAFSVTSPSLS
jgi:hypothetical protein